MLRRMGGLALALAAVLAVGGAVMADNGDGGTKPKRPKVAKKVRRPRGPRMRGIWTKLDLTEEQKAKYAELDKVRAAKVKEIMEKMKALQAERKEAEKVFGDAMALELTDDQKAKRDAILEEEKQKREERMRKMRERQKKPKPKKPETTPDVPDGPEGDVE